eukprot:jgi/Mesvir1/12470/Mv25476-RA.1
MGVLEAAMVATSLIDRLMEGMRGLLERPPPPPPPPDPSSWYKSAFLWLTKKIRGPVKPEGPCAWYKPAMKHMWWQAPVAVMVVVGAVFARHRSFTARAREKEWQAAAEWQRLEAGRRAAVERRRLEAERQAAVEQQRLEAERRAAAERQRLEAERRAAAERQRLEAERRAAAELQRLEVERRAAAERQRLGAERRAAFEQQRLEAERRAAAERQRLEAERRAAAERQRLEAERRAAVGQQRLEAERRAALGQQRLEAERRAAAERQTGKAARQDQPELVAARAARSQTLQASAAPPAKLSGEASSAAGDEASCARAVDVFVRTRKNFSGKAPLSHKCGLAEVLKAGILPREFCSHGSLRRLLMKQTTAFCLSRGRSGAWFVSAATLTPYQGDGCVYGKFKCPCGEQWGSVHSFRDGWQACRVCHTEIYPYQQTHTVDGVVGSDRYDSHHHDHARCDICQKQTQHSLQSAPHAPEIQMSTLPSTCLIYDPKLETMDDDEYDEHRYAS